jgi:hypothetical protein
MTASKSTNIALSQIAILEQALDEVPTRNATEVGKAKAIGILAPKIHALRAKGYAWREVAAWLTEHGVAVTVPALQRHLRGAKTIENNRDKAGAKGRRASSSSAVTHESAIAKPPPASQRQEPKGASPAAPSPAPTARTPARSTYGSFVPRPDTENI